MKRQGRIDRRAAARLHRRRGVAMILVMAALTTALILSSTYLATQSVSVQVSRNVGARAKARMIAESGLSMGLAYVRDYDDWRTDQGEGLWVSCHSFAGGSFSITGQDGEDIDGDGTVDGDGDLADDWTDMLTLTAEGSYGGAKHTVRAVVPPVKQALMIVPDADDLKVEDNERLNLLRGWGWKVRRLSAQATEAEFNAAAIHAHVVYFPAHTKLETDVKNRLKAFSLPVVAEHNDVIKELKVSSQGTSSFEGSSIEILQLTRTVSDGAGGTMTENVVHPITSPFAVGDLAICSVADSLVRLDGSTVDTQGLASQVAETDRITLAALECGALGSDSRPARARRVALPWGKDNFDFSILSLNDNGRTILRRSLDWAGSGWRGLLPGVVAWDKIEVGGTAFIDGYSAADGPYGGGNINSDATVSNNAVGSGKIRISGGLVRGKVFVAPNALIAEVLEISNGGAITGGVGQLSLSVPIPSPVAPSGMPALIGDRWYGTGDHVIADDCHFRKLTIEGDARVFISGIVRILCDGDFLAQGTGQLRLMAGAELTLYVRGKVSVRHWATVNYTPPWDYDPTDLKLMLLGGDVEIADSGILCTNVQSYDAKLTAKDVARFCGTFVGREVLLQNSAAIHVDTDSSGTVTTLGGGVDLEEIGAMGIRWVERR